jgi:hypothetical protein
MSHPCQCCNGTGIEPDVVDHLRVLCADIGIEVAYDDTVSERDAATLLHRKRKTLRNRRYLDCPLPPVNIGGRIRYRLTDIAEWMKANVLDE